MSRPTPAALLFARSTLPVRRVASPSPTTTTATSPFAALLAQHAPLVRPPSAATSTTSAAIPADRFMLPMAPGAIVHSSLLTAGGPAPISTAEILNNAEQQLNVPYVWGGNTTSGLDCSAYVSKAWGVGHHTTDTLASISQPISRDQLQAGDALNLTIARDASGTGHVRLFDRWANPEHTRMYVYEETPPRSIHHVINWDPSYQPIRRLNVTP